MATKMVTKLNLKSKQITFKKEKLPHTPVHTNLRRYGVPHRVESFNSCRLDVDVTIDSFAINNYVDSANETIILK